jgi:hypothetical protein
LRYEKLVDAHMSSSARTAAGPSHLPEPGSSLAATQACWRFLNNPRVTLPALIEPLRDAARDALREADAPVALLVHDWCKLDFRRHESKKDQVQLTHDTDVGYELTGVLLVSADDGSPLAPLEQHLLTSGGLLSTNHEDPLPSVHHLEQILPTMNASTKWDLPCKFVHVIDREADSVGHYRDWDQAEHLFLVRANDRCVLWNDQECLLSDIAQQLHDRGQFHEVREVDFHGVKVRQFVVETDVVLHRPAIKHVGNGKKKAFPGKPLSLRLVVVCIYDDDGELLSEWMLLTNVPKELADASKISLWYYWRWRIESYYKLLKSHGHEVSYWQQESGPAVARRLLIAAMACVMVWNLERSNTPESEELKAVLIKLSGRQMKRSRPYTAPALLAGLHALLSMLELLRHGEYDLNQLHQLAAQTIGRLDTG